MSSGDKGDREQGSRDPKIQGRNDEPVPYVCLLFCDVFQFSTRLPL